MGSLTTMASFCVVLPRFLSVHKWVYQLQLRVTRWIFPANCADVLKLFHFSSFLSCCVAMALKSGDNWWRKYRNHSKYYCKCFINLSIIQNSRKKVRKNGFYCHYGAFSTINFYSVLQQDAVLIIRLWCCITVKPY